MSRTIPITKQFPGMWVHRCKVWTPDRASVEITGPLAEHMGDFLIMALAARHDAKDVRAIKRLTKQLRAHGGDTQEEHNKRFPFHTKRHKPGGRIYVLFAERLDGKDWQSEHYIEDRLVTINAGRVVFDFRGTEFVSKWWRKHLEGFNGRVNSRASFRLRMEV